MEDEKKLVYIPILHTVSDMGSLAGMMKEAYVKKFGQKKWEEHVKVIEEMWEGIEDRLRRQSLSYEKTKVYQDGLPVCEKEKEIINELADQGSPNHQLVRWMMQQGATLMGTEDPDLLVREYHHVKKITEAKTHQEKEDLIHAYEKEAHQLLRQRDERVRDRIVETLRPGETGVLFMGLLHRVDELLPPEIQVSYLIHRLPFRRSFEMEMVI